MNMYKISFVSTKTVKIEADNFAIHNDYVIFYNRIGGEDINQFAFHMEEIRDIKPYKQQIDEVTN